MEYTSEQFTLATLAKFYIDAAEAGGMEYCQGNDKWCYTAGPNLNSLVELYRIKKIPIVRYAVKFTDGYINPATFQSAEAAQRWNQASTAPVGEVIKLVEEI